MERQKIIAQIVYEHGIVVFGNEEVIEVDSLQYLSILCAIEEHFNIQIPDDELIIKEITVNNLCALIDKVTEDYKSDDLD